MSKKCGNCKLFKYGICELHDISMYEDYKGCPNWLDESGDENDV